MHRWWGSSKDSEEQAAQRERRAARKTLSEQQRILAAVESDDEYEDCNLSNSFIIGVDGADDGSSVVSEDEIMPATIFQDENGTDDNDYYKCTQKPYIQ